MSQTILADCRFTRSCRLLTPADYAEVFAARRVIRGEKFVVHFSEHGAGSDKTPSRPDGDSAGNVSARLGLVIPKKNARAAVLRNAIKRQIREAFRQRGQTLPGVDIVVRLAQPLARSVMESKEIRSASRSVASLVANSVARSAAHPPRRSKAPQARQITCRLLQDKPLWRTEIDSLFDKLLAKINTRTRLPVPETTFHPSPEVLV